MDHPARLSALRLRLARERLDALLVSHLPNLRYLTGFTGSNALLLVASRRATLFTDGRYREQAAQEISGIRVVVPARGDLWAAAAKRLAGASCLGLEFDHVTLALRAHLRKLCKARFANVAGWVAEQRMTKDSGEIAALRRALNLASSVFTPTISRWRPGMPETTAAAHLEFALRLAGGEGLAFDTIIAGGAHGALVHAHPGATPLPCNGFVVCDYGVTLAGYRSDMSRTVHFGRPDARARKVYATVLAAQLAAIAAIRPGVRAAAIDRAARRVITRAGFGRYFPHSTGHGVGLEIHESPRLGARSQEVLATGQVITVEPGIYIPGWGGVRIEDMVLVTESGAEVLTPTPKDLLIL